MSREQILRVAGLSCVAYVLLASYAVARPSVESLFLAEHGADALPRAWVLVAVLALIAVERTNRWSLGRPVVEVFTRISYLSAALLAALLLARALGLRSVYALYAFKDLYVVFLVELFWTYANSEFEVKRAKWIYGLFCAAGALGGASANLGFGEIAARFGTERAVWGVVPILGLTGLLAGAIMQRTRTVEVVPRHRAGFQLLRTSRYVLLLVLLIAATQLVITLVDYAYNQRLALDFPATDARTRATGRVYAAIDAASFALQMGTGLILRLIGVRWALLAVPATLGAGLAAYALTPGFGTIAFAKVASKALDYSIFRAAKEILYIPLSYEEKTQGKALADVLAYRVAKGATSFLLMGLAALALGDWALAPAFVFLGIWVALTVALTRPARR